MRQRLVFGTLMIAALAGLLYADQWLGRQSSGGAWLGLPARRGLVAGGALAVLVCLATRELHGLFVAAGHRPLSLWPMLVNVALVMVPLAGGRPGGRSVGVEPTVVMLAVGLAGAFLLLTRRRSAEGAIPDIATTFFIIFYIGGLAPFVLRLYVEAEGAGVWRLAYYLATVKSCDIGAYFAGSAAGRHKLIPWLSPNKSWEGVAGGTVACIVVAVAGSYAARSLGAAAPAAVAAGPLAAGVFGLVMAVLGQTGDLLESLLKRAAHAKDSGSLVPAFGGVLDILDSLLLTAPIACVMLIQ